ncbi:MAG: PIN domain-containing protein [Candidatus Omnitrophota bacterium]|nr:PIN domain-containing protein [Candidatus Omnitrophota bacterium]
MKFLDTNIILRYLTSDIPSEALKCHRLFKNVTEGKEILFTNILVLAEAIWVLSSEYKFARVKVIEGIQKIINTPHIHIDDGKIILSALDIFETHNIDFIDAYNAAIMLHKGINSIYSYDKHFDRIKEIKRLKP